MFTAMQNKSSVQLHAGRASRQNLPIDSVRAKDHFAKAPALKNLAVHFLVARIVAALAAGSIRNKLAAGIPACRVKLQNAALQTKCPVHRMQRGTQGPV